MKSKKREEIIEQIQEIIKKYSTDEKELEQELDNTEEEIKKKTADAINKINFTGEITIRTNVEDVDNGSGTNYDDTYQVEYSANTNEMKILKCIRKEWHYYQNGYFSDLVREEERPREEYESDTKVIKSIEKEIIEKSVKNDKSIIALKRKLKSLNYELSSLANKKNSLLTYLEQFKKGTEYLDINNELLLINGEIISIRADAIDLLSKNTHIINNNDQDTIDDKKAEDSDILIIELDADKWLHIDIKTKRVSEVSYNKDENNVTINERKINEAVVEKIITVGDSISIID